MSFKSPRNSAFYKGILKFAALDNDLEDLIPSLRTFYRQALDLGPSPLTLCLSVEGTKLDDEFLDMERVREHFNVNYLVNLTFTVI